MAAVVLGVGYVLVFRVEIALALQERFAEAASWKPPSEDPEYYEDMRPHRRAVFRLGGSVVLAVGAMLLAMWIYGTFVLGPPPQ
jgi:ferric-dicitrate binding protein FerR (iron transport regulator)